MRLSLIFELLLIFVLLAFAASRVIDSKKHQNTFLKTATHKHIKGLHKNRQSTNKFCSCSSRLCNCCREFNIPVVALRGPGCASLQYLQGDRLAISMSFGERILSNTTISGRKPKPICMQLPGAVSKFCGRVYNIGREGEDFKACLGLELRALEDIEASLRVSCFRFGPRGLKVEPAQPLPVANETKDEEDEDDDDDDDDDEDGDFLFGDDYNVENDVESVDYAAFNVFDDDFVGGIFGDESDSDYGAEESVPPKKPTTAASTNLLPKKPSKPIRKPIAHSNVNSIKQPVKSASVKPIVHKTSMSQTTKSAPKTSATTATTARTVFLPITTQESKLNNSITITSVIDTQPAISNSSPLFQHESIAAVTAMLQTPTAELTDINYSPLTSSASFLTHQITNSVNNISDSTTIKFVVTESVQESLTNVPTEKFSMSEVMASTTDDPEKNKNEISTKHDMHTQDKNDNDDDNEPDYDPISQAVEEAIEDDDNDQEVGKNKTPKPVLDMVASTSTEKPSSQDILDDIADGVVDTITGNNDSTEMVLSTSLDAKKNRKDDDDNEDEDEDDEDDDNDDDEELARKLQNKFKLRSRHSKEMKLNKK